METLTGMRRRGISLGILSAEGAIAWFRPAEAVAVALTAMGGTLLVTLIVMIAVILGNNQICERVFRLLRWAANRPEPCALGQANGPGPAERHHHPAACAPEPLGTHPAATPSGCTPSRQCCMVTSARQSSASCTRKPRLICRKLSLQIPGHQEPAR
jgi:hypothetical protein